MLSLHVVEIEPSALECMGFTKQRMSVEVSASISLGLGFRDRFGLAGVPLAGGFTM